MINNKREYRDPTPTADIILRKPNDQKEILIETRGRDPFEGQFCLPGGHVDYGETVEAAALRELREECGVDAKLISILGVYSDPNRDPRGQRISTVFIGDLIGGELRASDDARNAQWMKLDTFLEMKGHIAFDHQLIISDYKKWLGQSEKKTFWSTRSGSQSY